VALILANPSRITQANFDRIQDGMGVVEVQEILWQDEGPWPGITSGVTWIQIHSWHNGPNWIVVRFLNGCADRKELHLATAWETMQWYAKKGAEKIGVKWD
jgi:hypothetical protein